MIRTVWNTFKVIRQVQTKRFTVKKTNQHLRTGSSMDSKLCMEEVKYPGKYI